jgi:hypothetical protein
VGRCGLDSSGSGQRPMASSCEHSNEPLGLIKDGKILNWLSNYQLLTKDSAQWINIAFNCFADHI